MEDSKEKFRFFHYTSFEAALHILDIPNSGSITDFNDRCPKLRYTSLLDLADPYEGKGLTDEKIDHLCPRIKELEQRRRVNDLPYPRFSGVISGSKSYQSSPLWLVHGKDATGVCLEFEMSGKGMYRVNYGKEIEDRLEKFSELTSIFSDERSESFFLPWLRKNIKATHKRELYRAEEEYRILITNIHSAYSYIDRVTGRSHLDLKCANYKSDAIEDEPELKAIYFGANCSKRNQHKLYGYKELMGPIEMYLLDDFLNPKRQDYEE